MANDTIASKFEVTNTTANQRKCEVDHDLPFINDVFVGRDSEMLEITQQIEHVHIIGINGAPGFGKSRLAIHFGYEMIKRGTSVQYIDVSDAFFRASMHLNKEDTIISTNIMPKHEEPIVMQSQATTLLSRGFNSLISLSDEAKSNTKTVDVSMTEILEWSKNVSCHTVLILDNCDDQIYSDKQRQHFIQFMKDVVNLSQNNIYIVLTSRQQLLIADDFKAVSVKELDLNASCELLKASAPKISAEDSTSIAKLLEGCPLALKVIGKLLNRYDDELIPRIEEGLKMQPIKVLDKASTPKERFKRIMDVTFERLSLTEQDFGFYVCLFPGSFSFQAAIAILPFDDPSDILSNYSEHSLLEEFVLGHTTRYKMHRLIREYLRHMASGSRHMHTQIRIFDDRFCKYFSEYLVGYAYHFSHQNVTESQEHGFKVEHQNIHRFLAKLLSRTDHNSSFTPLEIQGLVFAVTTNLIPKSDVHRLYHIMINHFASVCEIIDNEKCGDFYLEIIQQMHDKCGCKRASDFLKKLFLDDWPCEVVFTCNALSAIITHPKVQVQLNTPEQWFLKRMYYGHCKGPIVYLMKPLTLLYFHFTYIMLVICFPRQMVCKNPHHKHSPLSIICGITSCATLPMCIAS